jgi:general secretion pathway protein M
MRQPRTDRPADPAFGAPNALQETSGADAGETASAPRTARRAAGSRDANASRKRWSAIGLLLLALAAVYAIGLHWWWTSPMLAMGQRMDELREQELRFRMLAQQRPAIEQRLAELRRSEQSNPAFLPETSVELAQAGLTQRIESEVGAVSPDHGSCSITQRTPTASNAPERYQRVVVQVRLLCGMTEFSALLHSLESGRPQLFVTNLNLIGRVGFAANGTPETSGPLDIAFDLFGYLRPGVGASNAAANANPGGGDAQP